MEIAIFETERMWFRQLKPADGKAYHQLTGDEKVMRYILTKPYTLEETKAAIEKQLQLYQTMPGYGVLVAIHKVDKQLIGAVAIFPGDEHCGEFGYRLLADYWGQGLATEMSRGLLQYANKKLGLSQVSASVDPKNKASIRVLEKSGLAFWKAAEGDWVYRVSL